MKFLSLVRARSGPAAEFGEWMLEVFSHELRDSGIRCTVNVVSQSDPDVADVVLETWMDDSRDVARVHASPLLARSHIVTYQVTELVGKDELRVSGAPTPAIKTIAAWEARHDVARTEVRRHWDEHVPLANRIHVGCVRYVRNWVDALVWSSSMYPRAYQGFACQYFRTERDLVERLFDRPESQAVIEADVADFLTRFDVLVATEYVFE